jgi:hypothetical protein
MGILEDDPGPVVSGHRIIRKYEAMNEDDLFSQRPLVVDRLRQLVSEVEEKHHQSN